MDSKTFKKAARQVAAELEALEMLKELVKAENGRNLTEAGRKIIDVGLERGYTQSAMARLLDVTPGAVSRYVNS